MEFAKLVLRGLFSIAGFGSVLGAISAYVCPEAFTLGKPRSFGDLPAPALGLIWGWLEFMLPAVTVGLAIAMAANVGPRPAVKAVFFRKPILIHLLLLAIFATAAGGAGFFAAQDGNWELVGPLATLPLERHPAVAAVWWATRGAHVGNIVAGIGLAVWTWRKRDVFEAMVNARRSSG